MSSAGVTGSEENSGAETKLMLPRLPVVRSVSRSIDSRIQSQNGHFTEYQGIGEEGILGGGRGRDRRTPYLREMKDLARPDREKVASTRRRKLGGAASLLTWDMYPYCGVKEETNLSMFFFFSFSSEALKK